MCAAVIIAIRVSKWQGPLFQLILKYTRNKIHTLWYICDKQIVIYPPPQSWQDLTCKNKITRVIPLSLIKSCYHPGSCLLSVSFPCSNISQSHTTCRQGKIWTLKRHCLYLCTPYLIQRLCWLIKRRGREKKVESSQIWRPGSQPFPEPLIRSLVKTRPHSASFCSPSVCLFRVPSRPVPCLLWTWIH